MSTGKKWLIVGGAALSLWFVILMSEPSATSQKRQARDPYQPTLPKLSRMTTHEADPHICQKPDDAFWPYQNPVAGGSDQHSAPKFLFDASHADEKINWANGFKGVVPVCFMVDEHGNSANITFFQSPGKELEERITAQIKAWRYKPGMLKHGWSDENPQPIKVQLAFDFVFE